MPILHITKLWSTCVQKRDFQDFDNEVDVKILDDVVSICKSMGVAVDSEDEDLVEDHSGELTIKELVKLQGVH